MTRFRCLSRWVTPIAILGFALTSGTVTAIATGQSRTTTDAQALAMAESRVVSLLNNFRETTAWKRAFRAAIAAQDADLARLNADLGPKVKVVVVPNLINVRLDKAEADLQARGLNYRTVGGGVFGIVITADWTVCSQHPGPGAQVAKGSAIELDVEKFGCS